MRVKLARSFQTIIKTIILLPVFDMSLVRVLSQICTSIGFLSENILVLSDQNLLSLITEFSRYLTLGISDLILSLKDLLR